MSEREIPEGYRLEWAEEPKSRWLPFGDNRECSHKGCHHPAIMQLCRKRRRGSLILDIWYAYCAEHGYGRQVKDGVVKSQRLVKIEEGAA